MRAILDRLYALSGAVAATFLVLITLIVLAQVLANLAGTVSTRVFGRPMGLVIPSYAEFAGFFLAASSFFGLAYTLRYGEHIRVSLFLQRMGPRLRRVFETGCVSVALLLSSYLTWFTALLVWESWSFGDRSMGLVAIPLWLPQAVLPLGGAMLTIALADTLWALLRGRMPACLYASRAQE